MSSQPDVDKDVFVDRTKQGLLEVARFLYKSRYPDNNPGNVRGYRARTALDVMGGVYSSQGVRLSKDFSNQQLFDRALHEFLKSL